MKHLSSNNVDLENPLLLHNGFFRRPLKQLRFGKFCAEGRGRSFGESSLLLSCQHIEPLLNQRSAPLNVKDPRVPLHGTVIGPAFLQLRIVRRRGSLVGTGGNEDLMRLDGVPIVTSPFAWRIIPATVMSG